MNVKKSFIIPAILDLFAIALIAWAFMTYLEENEQRVTQQNLNYIEDSAVHLGIQIDAMITEGYQNMETLSGYYSRSLTSEKMDLGLLEDVAEDSPFDFLGYVDREGTYHTILSHQLVTADRQFYTDGMEGNAGMEIVYNTGEDGVTYLVFYAPAVFEGETVGVLTGVYESSTWLYGMTHITYSEEYADVFICAQNGDVIATSEPEDSLNTAWQINITGYITDPVFSENVVTALETGETLGFQMGNSDTIGCVTRMENSGWYFIQVFPEGVNESMVQEANLVGVRLEMRLVVAAVLLLASAVLIYRLDRRTMKEQVDKTESYKNAVLSGSIIMFEANLGKNMIVEGAWADKQHKPLTIEEILGISLPCDYDVYIRMWADKFVEGPSRAVFLEECSSDSLRKSFEEGKSEVSFDYMTVTVDGQEIFARRSIYLTKDSKTGDLIAFCNVKDITQQREFEEKLLFESRMDEMTKCYNRRSYEEDIRELKDLSKVDDLLYVSIDINGLKTVNDTMGHTAGDELILGTANCLKRCLGSYGKIYRTGGDEFIAILYVSQDRIELMKRDLAEEVYAWKGKEVELLSVSCGYAPAREYPGKNIRELARIADEKMYEAKDNYYRVTGLIRRKV